jgi:uncharacterized protein (TIGR02246 family)
MSQTTATGIRIDQNRADDEAAIRAVLDALYAAWAAGDADAFVAEYTPDATSILPGSLREGREAVRENMRHGFAGPLAGTTTVDRWRSLRFVGRDGAIVVSESGVLFSGQSRFPARGR